MVSLSLDTTTVSGSPARRGWRKEMQETSAGSEPRRKEYNSGATPEATVVALETSNIRIIVPNILAVPSREPSRDSEMIASRDL